MKKLKIDLANCYGIKSLHHELDFSKSRVFAIYAPNGVMKSSLAKTFKDLAADESSADRIFPDRASTRDLLIDGSPLLGESVFVIEPYDQVFSHTEKTSTLLVDAKLRKEYEQLHVDINSAKDKLIAALKQQSGTRRNIEEEVSATFTPTSHQFFRALQRIQQELIDQKSAPLADVKYDSIFDEKALALLATKDVKVAIEGYVQKYNELLDASVYFSRDTFNYYDAGTIAESLAKHGFFKAKHTVSLHGSANEVIEITDQKQLEAVINAEKDAILSDATLRKKFDEIQKLIHKNAQLRDFEKYLMTHDGLLPRLANIKDLKEDLWKSYLKANLPLYDAFMDKSLASQKRIVEIQKEAGKQRTQWEQVIDIFNDRFFVPFKLVAQNRIAVMLGDEPALELGFTFDEGGNEVPVERETLIEALSTGEKKALYILNIIFEVEARKAEGQKTLLIVDDIADSFDYKNKYAIIQYLMDIEKEPLFRQILLTHNFDFYRTVESRFVPYSHCLMAEKSPTGISLRQFLGIRNIFTKDWKKQFATDSKKRLACVPFVRNIVEYTKGEDDPDYALLTALLHWKPTTPTLKQDDLDEVFNKTFHETAKYAKSDELIIDSVKAAAETCLTAINGVNLENKIVLAMAIRLQAEQFMIEKIADPTAVGKIIATQTPALLSMYKAAEPTQAKNIAVLERVVLMTPENLHLNSFMYEPIVDMSDDHLRKLYSDVKGLK